MSNGTYVTGNYPNLSIPGSVLISSQILTGGVSSVAFSGIPANFNHLKIVGIGRTSDVATTTSGAVTFNGDTAGHYSYQSIVGTNTTVSAAAAASQTSLLLTTWPSANYTASVAAAIIYDIPCYALTTFYKNIIAHSSLVYTTAANNFNDQIIGVWASTSAITNITLTNNFIAGSAFFLYGVL